MKIRGLLASRAKDEAVRDGAVVPQVNSSGYAGPVLGGRYQVLASPIGETFYVYDHARDDNVRAGGAESDFLRFDTVGAAEDYVRGLHGADGCYMKDGSVAGMARGETEGDQDMARSPKGNAAALKAAKVADAKIGSKKNGTPVKAAAKAPAKAAAPAKTSGRGTGVMKPGTVGARTKELILAGKDNAAVIVVLQKEFPDKANSASNVNWYRNALKKSGELPR